MSITCRSTWCRHTAWWACEPNTSWCMGTSPPYSLQRRKVQFEITPAARMKHTECWGSSSGGLQRSPLIWYSLGGKVPPGSTVVSRKEKTQWYWKHITPETYYNDSQTDRCHATCPDLKWDLRGALPACGVWATAVSAVEQKPHEGSVSQHKKQTQGNSTIIKQDDLCVLFGSGTVETAEKQDYWKTAHSFNL